MNKIFKRIRQFLRALFARMEPADHEIVDKYLSQTEKRLFYKMDPAVQKHCVNVAATVLDSIDTGPGLNRGLLVKAALLHDIGKSRGSFTIMDRVWYVLVKKISPRLAVKLAKTGDEKCRAKLGRAFYIHLHHEEIGASLAEKAGLSKELVYLLRNHHQQNPAIALPELAVLRQADELN